MSIVSNNKINANQHEIEISVDAAAFEAAIEKAYMKARKNIAVNGFRKGKAPRKMIEKMYGENCFFEDAINELLRTSVADELETLDLELVCNPAIDVTAASKEDGVTYKITVTVKPVVEIDGYKGIKVEKVVNAVTDENVDAEIQKMRERNGRVITVEGRAAQNGDVAVIDFEGFKDGVAFDGGKENMFELNLGAGQFVPGFEEQIVGKNAGEEFTINVTFPEDYQMADLAGAATEFKIKLHELRTTELPELDDDFAKDTTEFDTLDEVKADIKAKLEENAARNAEIDVDNKIFEQVVSKMNAEIPEVMFDEKVEQFIKDFEQKLASQGLNMEMYLKFSNSTMEQFKEGFKPRAISEVKLRLALEAIAKLENVEVTDADAEAELAKMAEAYKISIDQIKMYVNVQMIKDDMAVSKAVDIIKENAVIA